MEPGERLRQYRILRPLGSGGMGSVYLAEDERLGRQVAIKLVPPDLSDDGERRARLEREARLLAAIDHAHVNTLFGIEEDNGTLFLVLQLVPGGTLETALDQGRFPLDRALKIARQVAAALGTAHAAGVIHRDVKPANIMLGSNDEVTVVDFGIAKLEESPAAVASAEEPTAGLDLTQTGAVIGTAAYMSPEQVRGNVVDQRSDMFSFGCVLFETLTGVAPFSRETLGDTLAAILEHDPDWGLLPATTPPSIHRLLRRSLRREPEARLSSMSDAILEIDEARDELGAGAVAQRPSPPMVGGGGPPTRNVRSGFVGALVALAVVGIALAAWIVRDPPWGSEGAGRQGVGSLEIGELRPLTDFPGSHSQPVLSPDGTRFAFVSDASGSAQLWVRSVEGDAPPIQITELEPGVRSPSWSPAEDRIAFSVPNGGIWTVGALGTPPPRRIVAAEMARNPSFSPDGDEIVFESRFDVHIGNADGSGFRTLENVPRRILANVPMRPRWSPDAAQILVFIQSSGPHGDFWLVPTDGGGARQLTHDAVEGGVATFSHDGREVIFSSKRGGSLTLWTISVDGGEPAPLTRGTGEDSFPSVTRDGRRLAYSNVRNERAVMISDPATGEETEIAAGQYGMWMPQASPEGDALAFFGEVSGGMAIFTMGVDGSDLRRVTRVEGESNVLPRYSRDGSTIIYYRDSPEPMLRRMTIDGSTSTDIFPGFRSETHQSPAEHPTGELFAWSLIVPPFDNDTTYFRYVDTGEDVPLQAPEGWVSDASFHLHQLRWSNRGDRLVGFAHDGNVWVCEIDGACAPLTPGNQALWSGDDQRLFVRRGGSEAGFHSVWEVDLSGDDERMLVEYGPTNPLDSGFDRLPDGRIVWVAQRNGEARIWLAELLR